MSAAPDLSDLVNQTASPSLAPVMLGHRVNVQRRCIDAGPGAKGARTVRFVVCVMKRRKRQMLQGLRGCDPPIRLPAIMSMSPRPQETGCRQVGGGATRPGSALGGAWLLEAERLCYRTK